MADQIDVTKSARQRYSLFMGLLAGLVFTLAAWGLDAAELALAHGLFFWLKLALCAPPCILASMLVSWLVFKTGSGVVRIVLWGASGAGLAWLASHAPNQGVSLLLDKFYPAYGKLVDYPFNDGFDGRQALALIVVTVLFLLISLLLTPNVEDSAFDPAVKKIVPIGMWLVMLAIAGLALDNLVNLPLREPVTLTNMLIQTQLAYQGHPDYATVATESGLRALRPLQDLLTKPRHLLVRSYDETIESVDVLVAFDSVWAHCTVFNHAPNFCEKLK
jgi:hypothetical protein